MNYLMKNLSKLAILLLLFTHGANAQTLQGNKESLYEEINRLREENIKLSEKLYGSVSSQKDSVNIVAKLDAKIDSLEQQIRTLKGKVEEAEYKAAKVSKSMDLFMKDIEFRFKQFDDKYANNDDMPSQLDDMSNEEDLSSELDDDIDSYAEESQASGSSEEPQGDSITLEDLEPVNTDDENVVVVKKSSSFDQYKASVEFIKKGNYEKANELLKSFISSNQDSDLIGNAYYWLGETYYVRDDYNNSAVNFLMGYQKDAQGIKAPDNLLKLGMSLQSLKKKDEACTTYSKLIVEYPKISKELKKKVAVRLSDLACN